VCDSSERRVEQQNTNENRRYVSEKHRLEVDFKYKLPKMKYKGDLSGGKTPTMQCVRECVCVRALSECGVFVR
jgi:hypothetical protein